MSLTIAPYSTLVHNERLINSLVHQLAVPCKKVSFAPEIVTETKTFIISEGSQARENPTGESRMIRMNYRRTDCHENNYQINDFGIHSIPEPDIPPPTAWSIPINHYQGNVDGINSGDAVSLDINFHRDDFYI